MTDTTDRDRDEIAALLSETGPTLSSVIAGRLVSAQGLQPDAARKRIQRAKGVLRLKNVKFPNNEAFLYLQGQEEGEPWVKAAERAVQGSAYQVALDSIAARGGVIPARDFPIASGCPMKSGKHTLASAAERALKELRLLELITSSDPPFLVRPGSDNPESLARARARLIAERILLRAVHDWTRKLGLGSHDSITLRPEGPSDDLPQFGGFHWDLVGPSYLAPLCTLPKPNSGAKIKHGFFVADVALVDGLDEKGIEYFLKKCNAIRCQRKSRPFLAMLVADAFSPAAFQLGRSKGYIFATPENLFGQAIATALRELISTLVRAANGVIADPSVLTKVFESLAQIEGAALNLRGPLFAMICAHMVEGDGGHVTVGKIARHAKSGETADIDILVQSRHLVRAIETKGHAPGGMDTLDDVKDWLERQVPRIHSYLANQSILANIPLRVEFWTSGRITDDALAYLQRRKEISRKYEIAWKDGLNVFHEAKAKRLQYVQTVLKDLFIRHPLVH